MNCKFALRPCRYGFTCNFKMSGAAFNEECLRESQETSVEIESPVKVAAKVLEERKVVEVGDQQVT